MDNEKINQKDINMICTMKRIAVLSKSRNDIAEIVSGTADMAERKALQEVYTNLENAFLACSEAEMKLALDIK